MDNKQLQLVRDKEINKKHKLGQKLAQMAAVAHGEQQQLEQLQHYQEDYLKMIQEEQTDWSAAKSQHYREFCYQLSSVINGQETKLDQTKLTIDAIKVDIQQQQHKIDVVDELIEKQTLKELVADNKRFQQESDALVSRRFFL